MNFCKFYTKDLFWLVPHSLTLPDVVSQTQQKTGYNYRISSLQKCLGFYGEKIHYNENLCVSHSFSFDLSLWWPLLLSTDAILCGVRMCFNTESTEWSWSFKKWCILTAKKKPNVTPLNVNFKNKHFFQRIFKQ